MERGRRRRRIESRRKPRTSGSRLWAVEGIWPENRYMSHLPSHWHREEQLGWGWGSSDLLIISWWKKQTESIRFAIVSQTDFIHDIVRYSFIRSYKEAVSLVDFIFLLLWSHREVMTYSFHYPNLIRRKKKRNSQMQQRKEKKRIDCSKKSQVRKKHINCLFLRVYSGRRSQLFSNH